MDERTSKLIGQLQQGLIDVSDSQIAEILRQAREEALAEARVILKDMMEAENGNGGDKGYKWYFS